MEYGDWKPFYDRVLDDMGYSRGEDRRAAETLADLVDGDAVEALRGLLSEADVLVAGAGSSLEDEVSEVEPADVVVAADSAVPRLLEAGVRPDAVVTDLDGAPRSTADLSEKGVIVAVHAHGDNVDLLRRWVSELPTGSVVPTCQCRPPEGVHCFGGFTDGDRAAYVADHFGARSIRLAGFDFMEAEGEKRRKLDWARKLLQALEERRDEALLDSG